MKAIAIVPARGGSRGIARKNLVQIAGKPLIQWTIECAQAATRLDGIFVSTEDAEIAAVVRSLGVEVWRRPGHLAQDDTPMLDVIQEHVEVDEFLFSERTGVQRADAILTLQPTCPLRQPSDIDGAIELMERTGCDSVVSYVEVGATHPARMAVVDYHSRPRPLEKHDFANRQALVPVWIRSGDIYLTRTAALDGADSLACGDCRAWVIPPERHCNIDEPADLLVAEWMLIQGAGSGV